MTPIRILIVDDSVVIRRLLSDTLSGDPALEVVGCGQRRANRSGEDSAAQARPDYARHRDAGDGRAGNAGGIRKFYPKLPVIMFSTLTERGAAATLDALALGASRLRHQTQQYRQSRGCHRAHSRRADPQDQGAVWRRGPLEIPAAARVPSGSESSELRSQPHASILSPSARRPADRTR